MNPPAPATRTLVMAAPPSAWPWRAARSPPGGPEHLHHGAPEDPEIEPQRPGVDGPAVELDGRLEVADRLVPADLPEPRDARLHGAASPVMRSIVLDLVDRRGPRPHQAHLAPEHVPDLRQLVEMTGAKLLAERGDARIIPDLEDRPPHLVEARQSARILRSLEKHGAELVQPEEAAVQPNPPLREERRPGRLAPYPGRVPEVRQPEGREPRDRTRHVDDALAHERGEGTTDGLER